MRGKGRRLAQAIEDMSRADDRPAVHYVALVGPGTLPEYHGRPAYAVCAYTHGGDVLAGTVWFGFVGQFDRAAAVAVAAADHWNKHGGPFDAVPR